MQSPEFLRFIAIGLALLGAVSLSLGAQFQNDAVTKHHAPKQLNFSALRPGQLLDLLKRPRWLTGSSFLVLAVILQLSALTLAPLIVVQPLGAFALIVTSVLNARIYKIRLGYKTLLAIALTTLGVGGFVAVAAGVANEAEMSDAKLLQVVGILLALLVMFGVLFYVSKGKTKPLNYIIGAGVLYGFVASLAKVVIQRIIQMDYNWLTLLAGVALIAAAGLGGWFVQNAYASGPPDLVIAGLTVIDPLVAVAIAIVILGEAASANLVTGFGFVIAGLVAMSGVYMLSRVHPQLQGKIDIND